MAEKIVVLLDLETGEATSDLNKFGKTAKKKGKKAGDNFSSGFGASLKGITKALGVIAGVAGSIAAALTFKESIAAASRQEDAINSLNSALKISGKFSEEASRGLQDYASELQSVTKFGDEAILETQALIQSLGNLSEDGLKEATKAATDMAAALNIDLRSAATLVGKAAAGEVGSFSRFGVSIQKGATNAETFSKALVALNSKFGGAAAAQVDTFSGATAQLGNTFGDVLEEIGFLITRSPIVVKSIKQLETLFKSAGTQVKEFAKTFDVFGDVVDPILKFNDSIISFVVAPLELLSNVFRQAIANARLFVSGIVAAFGQVAGKAGELLEFFSPDSGLSQSLKTFAESSSEVFGDTAAAAADSFSKITDFPFSANLAMRNEELRDGLTALNETAAEQGAILADTVNTTVSAPAKEAADSIVGVWEGLTFSVTSANEVIKAQGKKTASIIKGGMVKGISGGIQTMTQALVSGENAFEAFGNFILSTIGDLAIQLGTFFIAEGIAVEALNAVSGTGAIAAGAALVALGSLIKGATGGGGSGGGSSTSAGGSSAVDSPNDVDDSVAEPDDIEQASARTVLNMNIEGSLVKEQELAGYLAEVQSDGFGQNGFQVV